MEVSKSNKTAIASKFILLGLLLLIFGMSFGLLGSLQYLIPGFAKPILSFDQVRPLHVSSIVFWIISGAIGTMFSYLQDYNATPLYSKLLLKIQFILFLITFILICSSYILSIFGGREYWEYPPILGIPILVSWILLLINFFKSLGTLKNQPVYIWMWLTGCVFFLFTFLESYLWLFPFFRNHFIHDLTIQWKSYGSMVGSWNMLIYGSSLFLLEKISGNKKYSHSSIAFILYFTGLFNLMFNWGHHIYTLPTHDYVKHISYLVSMTELFIIGRIIYLWKSTVTDAQKYIHRISYQFIIAADFWIFLTLILAILMSIPGINLYTHGTHITVAHTMGATIGINTFLLLSLGFDILYKGKLNQIQKSPKLPYWILNISLLIFWLSLIAAGILKAKWQMTPQPGAFSSMMRELKPYFIVFFISGITLFASILYYVIVIIRNSNKMIFQTDLSV